MRRVWYLALFCFLAAAAGCSGTEKQNGMETEMETETETAVWTMTGEEAAAWYKEELGEAGEEKYLEPVFLKERGEHLQIRIGFDPLELGMKEYTEIAAVYQDKEFTHRIGTHYEWEKESGEISITPALYGDILVGTQGAPQEWMKTYENRNGRFFAREELEDWGNLSRMYLVQYVDYETGEKLERPVVTVVYPYTELGGVYGAAVEKRGETLFLRWTAVKEAEYALIEIGQDKDWGFVGEAAVLLTAEPGEEGTAELDVSEIAWKEECSYGIIGISEKGTTSVSRLFDGASLLEGKEEVFLWEEKETVEGTAAEVLTAAGEPWVGGASGAEAWIRLHLLLDLETVDLSFFPETAEPEILNEILTEIGKESRWSSLRWEYGRTDQKLKRIQE